MDFASWVAGMRFVSVVQGDDKQETCMSDRTDCSNVFLLIHSSTHILSHVKHGFQWMVWCLVYLV